MNSLKEVYNLEITDKVAVSVKEELMDCEDDGALFPEYDVDTHEANIKVEVDQIDDGIVEDIRSNFAVSSNVQSVSFTNINYTIETSEFDTKNKRITEKYIFEKATPADSSGTNQLPIKDHLPQHKTLSIKDRPRPFECQECQKKFPWKSHLDQHMLLHSGLKPYVCKYCEKSFPRKEYLSRYSKIHSGPRPFNCADCEKSFAWKSDLSKHSVTHSDEKNFSCAFCGKAFLRKQHLLKHKVIHSKEKPFVCPDCGRSFSLKAYLLKHKVVHRSEKQMFRCDECGRIYSRIDRLKRHMLGHSVETPQIESDTSSLLYRNC